MAKVSPVSIKYMIHANFSSEGALEKPDVIGAIFGQTEGLLGSDLEMRELQKEGKIGRIEVELTREGKNTVGSIKIPTALDQSETTLIAAAIETIEKIGPCDSQISIEKIEDVRGSKRDYIIERAKKLMQELQGKTDSREISAEIKDSAKISTIKEYGESKLPYGDISEKEIIVVEGRADVVNLVRNGINNVICMNGTKLPEEIKELSKEKDITLFVDGDRGGKLIAQNVIANAKIKYIAFAPDGKEVEELTGKEILMNLRKRIPVEEFLSSSFNNSNERKLDNENITKKYEKDISLKESNPFEINQELKEKIKELGKEIKDTKKALILDESLNKIKEVSAKTLSITINRMKEKPSIVIIDGTATIPITTACEERNV
ncbi:DNA primase, partial [Candidatus Woesearchaeota archaeon]|nr:DNA primase [Candidatus Woesearchaeota archaeon]